MEKDKKNSENGPTKKMFIRVINPMRADVYGVDYRRGMDVRIDAAIAKKAIENKDAVAI